MYCSEGPKTEHSIQGAVSTEPSTERQSLPFPCPADLTISHTSQDGTGILGHLGTLLAHVQLAVNQHNKFFSDTQISSNASCSLYHSMGLLGPKCRTQDLALLSAILLILISLGPSIQPIQISLQSFPTLHQINTAAQLDVICKLSEGALNPLINIIYEDIKQNLPKY